MLPLVFYPPRFHQSFLYYSSSEINLLYQNVPDYFKLYAITFIAILSLFWFCKNLGYVPLICYYGRYSIVVLGTHQLLITIVWCFLSGVLGIHSALIQYVIVMLMELLVIPIMITYLPRFTAQKAFFKSGWTL